MRRSSNGNNSMRNAFVGSPVERIEDSRFLRGRGQFVDDLARENLLHAVILRSAVAHGRIRSIDAAAARARPGVHAVITAADLGAAIPTIPLRQESSPAFEPFEQPVIAHGKVRYVGEPVAVVLAESAAAAEDALEAIALDIEALPAVVDSAAAGTNRVLLFEAAGSNLALTLTGLRGDADAAFARAPYVRRERFAVQRHGAVPMEPRGLLAEWDAGRLTVFGAAKVAFLNRRVLAKQMGLPESAIRMVENDVGGGFGARGEFYPEDFLIPFAARLTGRPVKWIEDRREHLTATNHARNADCELEIACEADGTILALRGRAYTDQGAYIRTNGPTAARNIAQVLTGPYRIPHVRIDVSPDDDQQDAGGDLSRAGALRGRLLSRAAVRHRGGRARSRPRRVPPAQPDRGSRAALPARHRRAARHRDADRQRRLRDDAGALPQGNRLEREGAHARQADRRALPRHRHRLLSRRRRLRAEGERAPRARSRRQGRGLCRLLRDRPGPRDGLRPDRGRRAGTADGRDQRRVPRLDRPRDRRLRLLQLALGGDGRKRHRRRGGEAARCGSRGGGRALGCAAKEVGIDAGMARGPDGRSLPLAAFAGTSAEAAYASNKRTYSYGAHAAHVAVDPKTGHVEVIDYVAVEDVGRIINPLTLHGQAVGAIVQGLGGAFLEHFVYDQDGQLLTGSFADYLLPTASDFPTIRAVALEERPSPNNPLGAKGAGEGGIIPVGGVIANAVAAALGSLGVEPRELPLSPPRVWQLINDRAALPT